MNISAEIPERLHSLATTLSWQDCANLLCLYDGWSQTEPKAESRIRCGKLADEMRLLVQELPFEWEVPPVEEHTVVTAIAEMLRTGVMPRAPERYRNIDTNPILKSRREKMEGN